MTVLGHQSSKVTTRHYNQAKMIDAVRAYQEVLLAEPEDQGPEHDPCSHLRSLFVR